MFMFVCLFVVLCFVNTVTAQETVNIQLIVVVVIISTIFCLVNVSVMAVVMISDIYQRHKSAANVKLATNPNVKAKDLERSIIIENPIRGPDAPPTEMQAFGTPDTVVHRNEDMSPM